ncbi:MAG: DUF1570 domain-containing protein [Phycisphaerales bacterium]|nr:DUF1570 domain-containing protein [Phycisphaerales bacterium]
MPLPGRLGPGSASASIALLATILTACSSSAPTTPQPTKPTATAKLSPILATDGWEFGTPPNTSRGLAITTRSYRLYTTTRDAALAARLPTLLEAALAQYRTLITPLPLPAERVETFVLANRAEWVRCVQMLWADRADAYMTIQRGGITANTKSVLFDLGPRDTLVLAAHEGWHQFTQATFKEPLPVWAEEGIATLMEGFRSEPGEHTRYTFMPWANLERFDRLRDAHSTGGIMDLGTLLASTPTREISGGDPLTWYAQVWALSHWLMQPQRRPAFERMVANAAEGTLFSTVAASQAQSSRTAASRGRGGLEVFAAYFGDPATQDDEYRDFIRALIAVGSRDRITQGSPPEGMR